MFFFFPEANVTRNSFIILSSVHQLLGKRIIRANYQLQLPSRYLAIILRRIFIFFRNFDLNSANLNYLYKILPSSFTNETKIKLSSRIELQFTFPSLWRLEFSNILLVDGRKLEYAEGKFVFFYERLTEGDQLGGVFRFRCYPLNTAFPETHILVD